MKNGVGGTYRGSIGGLGGPLSYTMIIAVQNLAYRSIIAPTH